MNVVLIDDEQSALDYLEDLLMMHDDIHIIGKYLNPFKGIDHILATDVTIVFLDINMSVFNGIDVAAVLKEKKPDVQIVFVTAYDDYALDAFEVAAVDYLMKPVLKERLDKTLTQVRKLAGKDPVDPTMKITLFHKVQFIPPGREGVSIQFNMAKVQQLFIYMLYNRTRLVRKEQLIDMLWEELEEKRALSQLYNAIYMIRKQLAPYEKFINITTYADSYRLNVSNTVIDVDLFEDKIAALPTLSDKNFQHHQEVIDYYTDNYLIDYDYLWVENERYRLQTLWVNVTLDLLHWYFTQEKYEEAMKLCLRICHIAPITEEAYFYLMKISAKKEAHSSVHYHFSQLSETLYREIQMAPNQKIINWYESWREAQRN